jgi:hypothetical protein
MRGTPYARDLRILAALLDDYKYPNRVAIYKHVLHALLADGAKDGCHTDVGTALRERLMRLRAVTEAANEWRGTYGVDCTHAGRALCAAVDDAGE